MKSEDVVKTSNVWAGRREKNQTKIFMGRVGWEKPKNHFHGTIVLVRCDMM